MNYEEEVIKAFELIEKLEGKNKTVDYVKDMILVMLHEDGSKITNIDHFDDKYFRLFMGMRIASYYKKCLNKRADELYNKMGKPSLKKKDNFAGINRYKEMREKQEMNNYIIFEKYEMEDRDFDYVDGLSEVFYISQGKNEEDALKKYIDVLYDFEEHPYKMLEIIFKEFVYETCNYELIFTEDEDNYVDIKNISDEILSIIDKNNLDEEDEILEFESIESLDKKIFNTLSDEQRKRLYFETRQYEFVCVEPIKVSEYKKELKANSGSLIVNSTKEKIQIANALINLAKKKKDNIYSIKELVEELNDAMTPKECLNSVMMGVGMEDSYGWKIQQLLECVWGSQKYPKKCMVRGANILKDLAEANFEFEDNFSDKNLEKLLKIFSKHFSEASKRRNRDIRDCRTMGYLGKKFKI